MESDEEKVDESDEYESETDSDEDDEENDRRHRRPSNPISSMSGPSLTEKEVKALMQLSKSTADMRRQTEEINSLKSQITSIAQQAAVAEKERRASLQATAAGGGVDSGKLDALQRQLHELEKRAQSGAFASSYTPLLVRHDPLFKKYFKLQGMGMTDAEIKARMSADGIDPSWLDKPDGVSPHDRGVSIL